MEILNILILILHSVVLNIPEYIDEKDFHGPICTDTFDLLENKPQDTCNCVCRHFSRWIVRAYTDRYLI